MERPQSVRFDDLAGLQALVADQPGPFGEPVRITQEMIDRFADLTGDRQWIHVDVERAKRESPLGTTVAHGQLLLSLLPVLTDGSAVSVVGYRTVLNYGLDEVRFLSPVPADSEVCCRRRLAHVRKKGIGGSQLTFAAELWVVGASRPALTARSVLVMQP